MLTHVNLTKMLKLTLSGALIKMIVYSLADTANKVRVRRACDEDAVLLGAGVSTCAAMKLGVPSTSRPMSICSDNPSDDDAARRWSTSVRPSVRPRLQAPGHAARERSAPRRRPAPNFAHVRAPPSNSQAAVRGFQAGFSTFFSHERRPKRLLCHSLLSSVRHNAAKYE